MPHAPEKLAVKPKAAKKLRPGGEPGLTQGGDVRCVLEGMHRYAAWVADKPGRGTPRLQGKSIGMGFQEVVARF